MLLCSYELLWTLDPMQLQEWRNIFLSVLSHELTYNSKVYGWKQYFNAQGDKAIPISHGSRTHVTWSVWRSPPPIPTFPPITRAKRKGRGGRKGGATHNPKHKRQRTHVQYNQASDHEIPTINESICRWIFFSSSFLSSTEFDKQI